MTLKTRWAVLACALCGTQSLAQTWKTTAEKVEVAAAGISFPTSAGPVSLTRTRESGGQAQGIDNVAQYASADGKIEATAYIYRPAYADAALAAMATSRAIMLRWPEMTLTSTSVWAAGGTSNGAIRAIYDDSARGLTTTAGFLKAKSWIVKLRVSGPYTQRDQVIEALDKLIERLSLNQGVNVDPVVPADVSECPTQVKKSARKQSVAKSLGLGSDPMMEALLQGVLSAPADDENAKPEAIQTVAKNGFQPLCIRERLNIEGMDVPLLQAKGDTNSPNSIIALLSDAGDVIEMQRSDLGRGYTLRRHEIGATSNYGSFDGPLSSKQLSAVIQGSDRKIRIVSRTSYRADGETETNIFVP